MPGLKKVQAILEEIEGTDEVEGSGGVGWGEGRKVNQSK